MTRTRGILVLSLALGLAASLSGCVTINVPGSGSSGGQPLDEVELDAAWLDDGRAIGIVTQGSSSCIPAAGEPTFANGVLTVELTDPEGEKCTADLAPRASVVTLPAGIDPTQDLEIVVTGTYAGDTDLDGDAGLTGTPGDPTEYLPSAGWFDDGGLVILTWGSSSCKPVIESAMATGPAAVTVTFVTPPADQVCTMDMGPRVVVTQLADEFDEDSNVQLLLTGGEFDDVTVRIAGSS